MKSLLFISRIIDRVNGLIGKLAMWTILFVTLLSAGNAISRYAFSWSSTALLEIQWYLFGAVFLLGGGYAFLKNAHVRIDVLSSRFAPRTRNWIDVLGIVLVVFPLCWMLIDMGWQVFHRSWEVQEMSPSAGGLLRWPAYLLIPLGFALLSLQAVSELIKRLNFLFCGGADPLDHTGPSETEILAHDIEREEQVAITAKQGRAS